MKPQSKPSAFRSRQPGISASPYIALSDFLHKLPAAPSAARDRADFERHRPILLGFPPENPYLESAIHDSQKSGVPIQSIYYSSAGRAGYSYRLLNSGQNDLSYLSAETGGAFYWEGNSNPVALQPFFDNINRRISEQYVMRLDLPNLHRGFERLHLDAELPQLKLVGPSQVYVP